VYLHSHRRKPRSFCEDPRAHVVVGASGNSWWMGRAPFCRSLDVGVHVSQELPKPTAARESMHEDVRTVPANHTPTGAGSEAAEGIHGTGTRSKGDRSGLDSSDIGRSFRKGADRSGSEPLVERDWVHESGYGGKAGAPRTSSEQRETAERASGALSDDASKAIDERPPSSAASSVTGARHPKARRSK
jgi:hypothetical protein